MSQNNSPTPDPSEANLRTEDDTHGGEHQGNPAAPQRSDVEGLPAPKPGKKQLEYYDDPRDAIEAAIDARRDTDNAETFEDWTNPKARWGQDAVLTNRQDRNRDNPPPPELTGDAEPAGDPVYGQQQQDYQPPQAQPPAQQQQGTPDFRKRPDGQTEYLLMVDGKPYYQTLDEMRTHAQKGMHADTEVNETKKLQRELRDTLEEVRALKSGAAPPREAPTQDEPRAPDSQAKPTPAGEEPSWADLAEKIQYGSKEEAAEALKQLRGERQAPPQQLTPETLRKTFRSVAREEQYDTESREAVGSFLDANDVLKKDRYLSTAFVMATHDEMREDMASLVAQDQNWDMDRAQQYVSQMTPQQVEKAHKAFATEGYSVRAPAKIIEAAGKRLTFLQQPTPAQPQGNGGGSQQFAVPRAQRQDNLPVQPQPRVQQPTQQMPQQLRPQTNAEVLAEEREARGLSSYR